MNNVTTWVSKNSEVKETSILFAIVTQGQVLTPTEIHSLFITTAKLLIWLET